MKDVIGFYPILQSVENADLVHLSNARDNGDSSNVANFREEGRICVFAEGDYCCLVEIFRKLGACCPLVEYLENSLVYSIPNVLIFEVKIWKLVHSKSFAFG